MTTLTRLGGPDPGYTGSGQEVPELGLFPGTDFGSGLVTIATLTRLGGPDPRYTASGQEVPELGLLPGTDFGSGLVRNRVPCPLC